MNKAVKLVEPVEELAQEIEVLSDGVKRLLAGRLTERALVTLIYDSMPTKIVGKPGIREVLNAAANLKELYVRKAKQKGASNVE